MATAYCDRSGIIGFARGVKIPEGMLPIVSGPMRSVKKVMQATARHAYDNKTLLVPGVPEARTGSRALAALTRYVTWLKQGDHPSLRFY